MAMTPEGRFIYLADYYDNTVTVVRTATDRVVKRIHVNFAFSLAVSPDGKTVYVGAADPGAGIPEIVTIATATNTEFELDEVANESLIAPISSPPIR